MNNLYPLKFRPILKDKIWGGDKLKNVLNKPTQSNKCGESWELSGVEGDISIIENGFLAGNNLEEVIEIYMGDLVGDKVYEKFGTEFPLLIKFIDANEALSIQVHPDDNLSKERHNAYGKTEMWYVMSHDKDAELIAGFNTQLDKEKYLEQLNNKSLMNILNSEKVANGDVFFMPAGRVHAIGSGILLAEIQQTSDVTYRIYDFDRKDDEGNERELHTDLALDAIDYTYHDEYKTKYDLVENKSVELADCQYFTTNRMKFDKVVEKDYNLIDSFVIYICTDGEANILHSVTEVLNVKKGDTVLLPAELKNIAIEPVGEADMLEVYIK